MAEWTTDPSTGTVWQSWTSGTSASGNDVVWATWTNANSTSAISSNEAIWASWTSADSGSITYGAANPVQNRDQYRETEEQRQARLERAEQLREELEIARLEKEAAQRKAEELLQESLDQEQLEQFDETKWFFVIGQSGKQYRIRHDWIGNVEELNAEGQVVASYCIHPRQRVPVEDSMLIQKLMLEADEPRFMQIANRTARTPRPLAV